MGPQQQKMLRVAGYSDRFSVTPGEEITFYVHCENSESYQADIVRLIHGDTNPAGPGYKEELINTPVSDVYPGKAQPIYAGSYILVPHNKLLDLSSFTICAIIYPTTPVVDLEGIEVGAQGILTKWLAEEETGYGLFINEKGELALRIGRGIGRVEEFSTGQSLLRKVWYKVWASYDARNGRVRVVQRPYVTNTNGGHGMSMLHPLDDTAGEFDGSTNLGGALANQAPLLMAASTLKIASGRYVGGGHFKDVQTPLEIPIHFQSYNGKIERPKISSRALSDAEVEALLSSAGIENVSYEIRSSVVGAWDFAANISPNAASTTVVDKGPGLLLGLCINMPVRGTTGFNWSSDCLSFRHEPQEYGAIHFHDESVDDARWEASFTLMVPPTLPSGVYAARLRIDRDLVGGDGRLYPLLCETRYRQGKSKNRPHYTHV